MDLSGITVLALRRRFDETSSTSARGRLIAALLRDTRRGARDLGERLHRRMCAERNERKRLRGLFASQRAVEAEGLAPVAGVDEVGVGPLAGPVVAAAVVLREGEPLLGLDDSKRLSRMRREQLAAEIRRVALAVSVAAVEPREIDTLNIYRASLEAMRRAVAGLSLAPAHVFVDARTIPDVDTPQTAVVGGDGKEACIAAASIVAKVHRDALMRRYEERFPGYGFARHKGYPTPDHLAASTLR